MIVNSKSSVPELQMRCRLAMGWEVVSSRNQARLIVDETSGTAESFSPKQVLSRHQHRRTTRLDVRAAKDRSIQTRTRAASSKT